MRLFGHWPHNSWRDMMKFISDGTWFDKGTECERLIDCGNGTGLYKGLRKGELDEEMCLDEEFEVKDND